MTRNRVLLAIMVVVLLVATVAGFSCTGAEGPQGPKGDKGDQGEQGLAGSDGADGLSAYQIWLDEGNTGTKADFLASLQGPEGPQGLKGDKGDQGEQGLAGSDGADGLSAYQIWLSEGNTGTEADFLASLKGQEGPQGIQGPAGPEGPNMIVAMAAISFSGYVWSGYNVDTCTWNEGEQAYLITLTGVNYVWSEYVTIVTPTSQHVTACGVTGVDGKLYVRLLDSNGNPTQAYFTFVVLRVPSQLEQAKTELHQAQTAIAACMADVGTDLLSSYNDTTGWNGGHGVITTNGYDAADYIHATFKAHYLVAQNGDIVGAINDSWVDIHWDAEQGNWVAD